MTGPAPAPRGEPVGAQVGGQTIRQLLLSSLLVPALLLLGLSAVLLLGVRANLQNAELVTHSRERLNLITQLQTDLFSMENTQRGYVIIGDEGDRQAYRATSGRFRQNVAQLKERAATERQRANTDLLSQMVTGWQRQSAEPEMQARTRSMNEAVRLIRTGRGKQQLQEARDLLTLMAGRENIRVLQLAQRSAQSSRNVQGLTIGGLLLGLLLTAFSVYRSSQRVAGIAGQLTAEAQHIARGEYDLHISRSGVRELDVLARQFEQMAAAVGQRERALDETQRSLESINRNLQRSNRELERFAHIASHDLQEPLRTIASYTELLQRRYAGQLDDRADTYMKFTVTAATRLKNMIQDLLTFSRVHRPGRAFTQVNTAELVGQVLAELQVKIADARAQVRVDSLPSVTGNPELLHHIFLNLIMNAVKFRSAQRSSRVRVWAERAAAERGEGWVFHVQDNGIGIDPAYFARIFEVFQRLHPHEEYQGSGVGLAVIRSAAEQHGGRVWLDSVPDQGSTFHVFLPDQPPAPQTDPSFMPS